MNFDKFKKKTNSDKFISKCKRLDFSNIFNILKVVDVVNYYTIEAVIYNHNKYHKIIFELKDVSLFDDKLTTFQHNKMADFVRRLVLDKFFKFKIHNIYYENNKKIYNLRFIGSLELYGDDSIVTINTSISNSIINILIMKDKINKLNKTMDKDEGLTFSKMRKKNMGDKTVRYSVRKIPLDTISEEPVGSETNI
jgi:hypothetical protein